VPAEWSVVVELADVYVWRCLVKKKSLAVVQRYVRFGNWYAAAGIYHRAFWSDNLSNGEVTMDSFRKIPSITVLSS